MPINAYEQLARLRKADALADTLETFGITPAQAVELTVRDRLDLATIAGVKVPSETTWTVVVETLRRRQQNRARAAALRDDPLGDLA